MSSTSNSDSKQGQSEVNTLNIASPYENTVERFDNPESFSDLDFVIAGLEKLLQLHKIFLAKSSGWFKPMLKGKGEQRIE